MNPLAKAMYTYYNNDAEAFDDEIEKWGVTTANAEYIGNQFGYHFADAYTALNDKFGRADTWSVLDFATELFSGLDEETKREVGEAIIADYKKRKKIAK